MSYFDLYPADPDEIIGISASMLSASRVVGNTAASVEASQQRAEDSRAARRTLTGRSLTTSASTTASWPTSARWAYDVNGRIDLAESTSSITLLPDIRAALEAAGWEYDASPVAADPKTSVTAFKGDLYTRVLAYTGPFLLVAVSGPCLEASAAMSEDLTSHGIDEPLPLPN